MKFKELEVGRRFRLFDDSTLIYKKTNKSDAKVVHREAHFSIELGREASIWPSG